MASHVRLVEVLIELICTGRASYKNKIATSYGFITGSLHGWFTGNASSFAAAAICFRRRRHNMSMAVITAHNFLRQSAQFFLQKGCSNTATRSSWATPHLSHLQQCTSSEFTETSLGFGFFNGSTSSGPTRPHLEGAMRTPYFGVADMLCYRAQFFWWCYLHQPVPSNG